MPPKAKPSSPWGKAFVFRGFVNCSLTAQQKAQFRDIRYDPIEVWTVLNEIVGAYKFSLATDNTNDAFIASLTCMNPAFPGHGYILSARAGDAFTATCALLFKHITILKEDWKKRLEEVTQRGVDDID